MQYYHFTEELLPFSRLKSITWTNRQCSAFINLMNEEVAYTPLLHKYNEYGRPEIALNKE